MNTKYSGDSNGMTGSAVLWFGAAWGLLEATVGFFLHLLPRISPLPNLSGTVMFPLALLCMVAAIRSSGQPGAALGTAVVAAGIKVVSLALPVVSFAFVRSPVLAILAEGAIVSIAAATGFVPMLRETTVRFSLMKTARVAIVAIALSVGWRALFLLENVVFGIQRGIMAKPASVIVRFATVEAIGSALVIAVVVAIAAWRESGNGTIRVRRPILAAPAPAWGTLLVLIAVAAEFGTAFAGG